MGKFDQALLLARYCIEDPEQTYVSMNLKAQQTTQIISSIMKQQLKNYKILNLDDSEKIHDEVYYVRDIQL
jgi:hypothetical protein